MQDEVRSAVRSGIHFDVRSDGHSGVHCGAHILGLKTVAYLGRAFVLRQVLLRLSFEAQNRRSYCGSNRRLELVVDVEASTRCLNNSFLGDYGHYSSQFEKVVCC